MKPSLYHGFLGIDKPGGKTSRDVVNRALGWFPRGTKLGHTGTLDPLATGVLVLAVGTGTRLTEHVQEMNKTYRTSLILGAGSDTDDADGTVTPIAGARPPDSTTVVQTLQSFIGDLDQVPPVYCAAKIEGRRAYDLARRGLAPALSARHVRVYGIDILSYDYPHLDLEVRCGKGTYIRALARDLGEQLGCGAYVYTLRRTQVGPFTADEALDLEATPAAARAQLRPLEAGLADLPAVHVSTQAGERLCRGQSVPLEENVAGDVAVFDTAGRLIGVAHADPVSRLIAPAKILQPQRAEGR